MSSSQLFDLKLDSVQMDLDLSNLSISDYEYSSDDYEIGNDDFEDGVESPSSPALIFELQLNDVHTTIDDVSMLDIVDAAKGSSTPKKRPKLVLNSNFNLIYSNWSSVVDYKNLDMYDYYKYNCQPLVAPSQSQHSCNSNQLSPSKPYVKPLALNKWDGNMVLSPQSVHVPTGSKFFVIKSFNETDIKSSFLHKIWSSTDLGNKRLNKAFKCKKAHERVFIFFSVNGSGKFCGIAEMTSDVEDPKDVRDDSEIWLEKSRWKGKFNIQWIFVKDIMNSKLKHLKVPQNDWKPVTNSRDTQELPFDIGFEMIEIFKKTCSNTSFLQTLMD